MHGAIGVRKRVGETPLQCLERFRRAYGFPADMKIAYAGRLDPMASGVLLLLLGDECKRMKRYCALDKEYDVDVLLGIGTDSGDVLGLIDELRVLAMPDKARVREALRSIVGSYAWRYPIFSSRTVRGKPLFQWYYEGRLEEIEVPIARGEVYDASLVGMYSMTGEEVRRRVRERIALLDPVVESSKAIGRDFRRAEILARWDETLRDKDDCVFFVARVRCRCSAGTYMRTFAGVLGERLGVPALAFSIQRTKMGRWVRFGPLRFFIRLVRTVRIRTVSARDRD